MEDEKLQMDETLPTQTQDKKPDKSNSKDEVKKASEKEEQKDKVENLKDELDIKDKLLAQTKQELELYKKRFKDAVIRTAIIAESKNLMAKDPELIYLVLRSSCDVRESSDGGYEIFVRFETRASEGKLEFEELELPRAISKLFDKYPYLREPPKDKGSGSQSSTFSPLTLESVKTLSFEELLARKSELESLAKRLLG